MGLGELQHRGGQGDARAAARYPGFIPHLTRLSAARVDEFLEHVGTARDEPLTVLTDGADEFRKTLECGRPIHRLLDWFHIGMKLKA